MRRALAGLAVTAACVAALPASPARSQSGGWRVADAPVATSSVAFLPEGQCADGRDDDQDGATDCGDADCAADVACANDDFDGDGVANAVDCAPLDAGSTAPAPEVALLRVSHPGAADPDALVTWDHVAPQAGPATVYDLISGGIARMWQDDGLAAAALLARGLAAPPLPDARLTGVSSDGYWYLVRTRNACGSGSSGASPPDDDPPWDEAPTNCGDGLDNDGDGLIDCADAECTSDPACIEICGNGLDDDADGRADCDDPECIGACPETAGCANGVDDDGDGAVDCDDADCANDAACCSSCPDPLALLVPEPNCQVVTGLLGPCTSAWYRTLLVAGQCVQFTTCSCGGGATFDAALSLVESSCTRILASPGEACDGGGTAILRYVSPLTGAALLEVFSPSGATGTFTLSWSTCREEGSCANGFDDDGDGDVDCADAECAGDPACPELCSNGTDDDADGDVDCGDTDCIGDPACPESAGCDDGVDNDGDGDIDCADADCALAPPCQPCFDCPDADPIPAPTPAWQIQPYSTTRYCPTAFLRTSVVAGERYEFTLCPPGSAGFDSQLSVRDAATCDLLAFNDDACGSQSRVTVPIPAGVTEVVVEVRSWGGPFPLSFDLAYRLILSERPAECGDGLDNDGDGFTDCADRDCQGVPACPEAGHCDDRVDNDLDGLVDCADLECVGVPECPEAGHCRDGVDNDLDGATDCADAECIDDPACCDGCASSLTQLASPLSAYQTVSGTTSPTCTAAWYTIGLAAGTCVEVTTCPPGTADQDSLVSIWSPSCSSPATNDDACGTASRLLFSPTVSGLHRIEVRSPAAPMSYTLAWRACVFEDDATECSNGVDDDFDGDVDCADAGCAGIPPC